MYKQVRKQRRKLAESKMKQKYGETRLHADTVKMVMEESVDQWEGMNISDSLPAPTRPDCL
jgi:hypothetical protein